MACGGHNRARAGPTRQDKIHEGRTVKHNQIVARSSQASGGVFYFFLQNAFFAKNFRNLTHCFMGPPARRAAPPPPYWAYDIALTANQMIIALQPFI